MNGKRYVCLLLAALMALLPLAALAEGERFVTNTGSEPAPIYARPGDETPAKALAPGDAVKWLGEEWVNGVLWYRIQGGYLAAGPGIEVKEAASVEPKSPAPEQATEPETPAPRAEAEPGSEEPVTVGTIEPEAETIVCVPEPKALETPASVQPDTTEPPAPVTETEPPEAPMPVTVEETTETSASMDEAFPASQAADEPEPEEPAPVAEAEPEPEVPMMLSALKAPESLRAGEDPVVPGTPQNDSETPQPTPQDTDEAPDPTATATPAPTITATPAPTATAAPDPTATPALLTSPTPAATPAPTATPRPGGVRDTELVIDTAYIYSGMTKSYAGGYMPTVSKGKALFMLPLQGDVMGDVVRVTPEISTSGPFVYGNYQFDLKKTTEKAADSAGNQASRQVFLIRLSLNLIKNRYNGTYPLTFRVGYTDKNGQPAEQSFTLQVTITDGKTHSTGGGGGGGPAAVKKPVLVLETSRMSRPTIPGGEGFILELQVKNVGDLEAKNVRVAALSDGQGIYRSDSMAPLFLSVLGKEESAPVTFPFASDKTVFAGRHGLTVELTYEDKYGNTYGDTVPLQINVTQDASIGFDEMKLPETLTSGDTFTQPVCVYNTGYAPVYNVRCTLRMDGLIAASAFLGTLEPQQSADKAVSIFVTTLSGQEKYGSAYGELVISYEDMAGEEHTEFQSLRTTIQAPVEITDEEKLKQEKEQKEQQTLSQWWVSLLVSIAFILVILSVIVIARFTRMLKMR